MGNKEEKLPPLWEGGDMTTRLKDETRRKDERERKRDIINRTVQILMHKK
jgi:hypothetical protein